jgi:hypothetical protein
METSATRIVRAALKETSAPRIVRPALMKRPQCASFVRP